MLNADDIKNKESNSIWQKFQYKFSLTSSLVNYKKFYREGVLAICQNAIDENVSLVEMRFSSGKIFDDNLQKLSLDEEFSIYYSVLNEVRQRAPYFQLRVIITSPKTPGGEAAAQQLKNYQYLKQRYDIVSGFDLVNEEDTTPPISDFVDQLEEARRNIPDFSLYLHAGESTDRYNENLYDAILLGTKRIGHGLAIDFHPYLVQLVRDNNIGYEI